MAVADAQTYAPSALEEAVTLLLEQRLTPRLGIGSMRRASNTFDVSRDPLQLQGGTFAVLLEDGGASESGRGDIELLMDASLRVVFGLPFVPADQQRCRWEAMRMAEDVARLLQADLAVEGATFRSAGTPLMTPADQVLVVVARFRACWSWRLDSTTLVGPGG